MSTAQLGRSGKRFKRNNRHLRRANSGVASLGLTITNAVIDDAVVGQAYNEQMVATPVGGPAKTWTSSDLPPNLSIDSTTGVISGNPTGAGTATPRIYVSAGGITVYKDYSMTIAASGGALAITTAALPIATLTKNYVKQMVAVNVVGTPAWSMTVSGGTAHNLVIDPNTGKITATPMGGTASDRTVTVTVDDDSGGPSVSKPFTLTIIEAPVEITTTSLPAATVGTAYSKQMAYTGGVGSIKWKAGTLLDPNSPNWPEGISMDEDGLITGTPATGTDGDRGQLITVTASSFGGVTEDAEGFTFTVNPKSTDPGGFVGYANRRIGFCKNSAGPSQVRTLGTVIANGTNRLAGGLIRLDLDGRAMGGSTNPTMGQGTGSPGEVLDAIVDTGAKGNAILGYSHRDDQRTLTFQGQTIPANAGGPNRVVWTGGVGTGLSSQGGVAGHRPTLPGDGMMFGGMSIHGPGIPTGGRLCSLRDYDYINWHGISNVYLPLNGSVTANSGTYTIGGTSTTGDSKLAYKNPADAETVAKAVITQGGSRIGAGELWNEVAWPLGTRPFTDVPLMCRTFAHQYVGIKKALKDAGRPFDAVIVIFAGTGMINDDTAYIGPGANHFFNAQTWYGKCLDFFLDDDPDYFSDLMTARGLTGTYAKTRAPKFPGDTLAMHPYGQGTTDPSNMGMNQCAKVYNMVGARAGAYLPLSLVEQGLSWTRDGSGVDNHNKPNLDRLEAYTRYKAWIDILHGNRPWPYNTRLQGPGANTHLPTGDGTGGTITLTERRRKMRMACDSPQWFAIRPPQNAHAELGVGWDKNNNQKYVVGTDDAVHAMAHVDISGI